jgi:plastocyanin
MKKLSVTVTLLIGMIVLIYGKSTTATTHTIQFGGSVGYAYSPSSFTASVGDTVLWEGSFSMHPLSSTSVPSGAKTWQVANGSSFSYPITTAGSYKYQCDLHYSLGMVGSFTVSGSTALLRTDGTKKAADAVLFSSGGRSFLRLNIQTTGLVNGTIYSVDGRKTATVVNSHFGPGVYTILLPNVGNRVNIVKVSIDNRELIRTVL